MRRTAAGRVAVFDTTKDWGANAWVDPTIVANSKSFPHGDMMIAVAIEESVVVVV
jgi:hypothetical protein